MQRQNAAFHVHNHDDCSGDLMARADRRARQEGLRLTPVRRRVLEILAEAHQAMGAYEILERLKDENFGSQPPVAYRALDFLVENGFAHRIRRLNAFTACMTPNETHSPVFLICEECDAVAELSGTNSANSLRGEAKDIGFEIARMNLEAVGRCPKCQT